MKRGGLVAALAVVGVVLLAAAAEIVEVTDQTGAVVRIEGPIDRIASVYGAGTFYLYALGAQERIVAGWYLGVKGIAQASAAMHRLEPRLAEMLLFGDPNAEELVSRGAQLVLVDESRHAAFADQMEEIGIPALRFLVETPEALIEALRLTGRALGPDAVARAEAFAADYDRVFTAVRADLADLDEPAHVLFLGTSPTRVASGDMYQTHLIEAAGGVSVTESLGGYWNEVNLEQILRWDPDVILIPPYGPVQPNDLLGNSDWRAVRAVRDGRVYRMPRLIAAMDTPVPESILGVVWIACALYPDLVSLDLIDEAVRFYEGYYGLSLTEDDLALLATP